MKTMRRWVACALLTLLAFNAAAHEGPVAAGSHTFVMLKDGASSDMAVDGTTPVEFDYQVPAGERFDLERINIVITDTNITNDKFGGITALTNGLTVEVIESDGTTLAFDFTADKKIRTNTDFAFFAGSDTEIFGSGLVDAVLVRWTISKAGAPLRLDRQQYLRVTVSDNLTGLTSMGIMVQGIAR